MDDLVTALMKQVQLQLPPILEDSILQTMDDPRVLIKLKTKIVRPLLHVIIMRLFLFLFLPLFILLALVIILLLVHLRPYKHK